jgi:hypothetical protein
VHCAWHKSKPHLPARKAVMTNPKDGYTLHNNITRQTAMTKTVQTADTLPCNTCSTCNSTGCQPMQLWQSHSESTSVKCTHTNSWRSWSLATLCCTAVCCGKQVCVWQHTYVYGLTPAGACTTNQLCAQRLGLQHAPALTPHNC